MTQSRPDATTPSPTEAAAPAAPARELNDAIGLFAICPESACRRAARCVGDPGDGQWGFHPCFSHYREEMRFLLAGPHGTIVDLIADALDAQTAAKAGRDPCAPASGPEPATLLELLYGGRPNGLRALARPKGMAGPHSWENDPSAFQRYMDAGDWRDPGAALPRLRDTPVLRRDSPGGSAASAG